MNKIILDGKDFKTKEELHKVLKTKLELPEYYGENLDALWDCLTGWIDLPMEVVWINFKRSKEYLGDYAKSLLEIFDEAQKELKGFKIIIKDTV